MTLKIVPLTPDQSPGLAAAMATLDPWHRLNIRSAALHAYLDRDDSGLQKLALMQDGQLAGAMALRSPWLRGPYLELMLVLPAWQNRGLGRMALQWAIAQAQDVGSGNFWACVSAFNADARRFYAKMGFHEQTELSDLVVAGENEVLLRKILPALPAPARDSVPGPYFVE